MDTQIPDVSPPLGVLELRMRPGNSAGTGATDTTLAYSWSGDRVVVGSSCGRERLNRGATDGPTVWGPHEVVASGVQSGRAPGTE